MTPIALLKGLVARGEVRRSASRAFRGRMAMEDLLLTGHVLLTKSSRLPKSVKAGNDQDEGPPAHGTPPTNASSRLGKFGWF